MRQKAGRIIVAGMTKEVTFEPVDGAINDRVDEAYRAKYADSPYLSPMIGARARAATVKVMPRSRRKESDAEMTRAGSQASTMVELALSRTARFGSGAVIRQTNGRMRVDLPER